MDIPLFDKPEHWVCPNCDVTDVTPPLPPGSTRYHTCQGLHGLTAPMIREGMHVKVEAEERQDYLNGDQQATGDDGRAYMGVRVTREDGDDVTVFAGLAHVELRS